MPIQSEGQSKAATNQPLKLLLVEDDPNLLRLFSMVVEGWDFPVELTIAQNGFQGLLRIGQMRPDLVVTDLNMPGVDGFEMLRSLKTEGSGFEGLDVIVVSALELSDIRNRGGLPEGVRFLQKPVDFVQIESIARDLLGADTVRGPLSA